MSTTAKEAAVSVAALNDPSIKQALQELRRTDNVTNLIYLARTYLYFALVIGGTLWLYTFDLGWYVNVPVTMLAIILIGAGQHQLTALAHEGSHHILVSNRYLNDLVSDYFCMFPLYSSIHHYRLQHMAHHQFVNDPERDPDISQLKTSGHWLNFPISARDFIQTLLKQLWIPNLFRYMRIRAAYNAIATDKNPYLKKGFKPNKTVVRVGIVYMLVLACVLAACVYFEQPVLLAVVPAVLWASMLAFIARCPEEMFHQSRVHPVISMRVMSLGRVSYITAVFCTLAWLSLYVTPYAALFYFLLWLVPIFTSFSFFMILRQLVQHGNGDRGWLTNTRVFRVNPFISFAVFPLGQDYHLPHHIFASVPHYRLKKLHEALMTCQEYRDQVIEVEGYFYPPHVPATKPTVVEVVGPNYFHRAEEIYIDNSVLEGNEIDDKDEIVQQGEEEKRKRREEMANS